MSVFTNLLNLFKWDPEKDAEEEFDIDKALNDNWDKLDNKIDAHTKNTQLVHKNATADLSGFMSKEDKKKLDNIEEKAEHNIIEKIQKNGEDIPVVDKVINIALSKSDIELDKVDNTSDLSKPISLKTKQALEKKVDKEEGKGLSSNDFTNDDKKKLIPSGGTTGQVLVKKSNLDNETEWADPVGGGSATGDTLPIGSIMPYLKATAPENWLICDGSAISRTDYSELFNAIGTTFGEGDGSTTFNLPNIKGRTIVGLDAEDTDFNAIGKTIGEKTHTLTVAEMPEHTHKFRASTKLGNDESTITYGEKTSGSVISGNYGNAIQKEGSSQSHNNIQPSFIGVYIIKAKQSAGLVATVVDSLESTSATDALSAKKGKELSEKITTNITTGQEFATNTYIDGKMVYAKRLKGTWGTETNMSLTIGLSGTDFTPLKFEFFVNTGNTSLFSGNTPRNGADTEIFGWWNISGDSIFCSSAGYNRQGSIVTATVYYTKATEEEVL